MKKNELIQSIAEKKGFPKKQVKETLELAIESLYEEIRQNGSVVIPTFGTLILQDRPAKTKTNSETGETVEFPAQKVIVYRPANPVKEKLG